MMCGRNRKVRGNAADVDNGQGTGLPPLFRRVERMAKRAVQGDEAPAPATGNSAFDAYIGQMLAELERRRAALADEEREFALFLDKLKHARDKQEFDQFITERTTKAIPSGSGQDRPQA